MAEELKNEEMEELLEEEDSQKGKFMTFQTGKEFFGISISQIADEFGLTANYLSTLFHRKTGGKFIDYLTNIRMEAAKKLLVQNVSATVQDVALMVGYNSARHFSSLFQKQTGETPSSYRKNKRK